MEEEKTRMESEVLDEAVRMRPARRGKGRKDRGGNGGTRGDDETKTDES